MSLEKLLDAKFGVKTRPLINRMITQAGVTPTIVVPNDPNRLGLTLINLSASAMYLALASDVSATKGIYLAPNGGNISLVWDEDFIMVAWEWWIIAGGAGSALYCLEMVEDVAD